jgi:hypothetical protein
LFTSMLFSLCAASSSSRSPPPPLRILPAAVAEAAALSLSFLPGRGVCFLRVPAK